MTIENYNTTWEITAPRFVAFFDILGFKDKIMRQTDQEIYQDMQKLSNMSDVIRKAPQEMFPAYKDCSIEIVNFSDSIVVFTKGDDILEFEYFIITVSSILYNSLQANIPLKGGLAHGSVTVDTNKQIYFGQPIIDAYLLEEDVFYLGAVAHHSIDKYLKDRYNDKRSVIDYNLIELKSHLKSGKIKHTNINYLNGPILPIADQISIEEYQNRIEKLLKNFFYTSSGRPRKYIENTIEFFEESLLKYKKDNNLY